MQRAASSQELRQQFREQPEEEKKNNNSMTRLREMQRVHHDYDQHQQEEHRITIMSTTPMEVIIMIFTSTIQTRLLRNVRTVNSNRLAPSASRSATITSTTTIQSPRCSWATTTRHQRHHHVRPLPDSPPTTARLAISTRRRRSAIRVAPTT